MHLDNHTSSIRSKLAELQGMSQQTAATDAQLRKVARERLDRICADIEKLRPRAATDPDASLRYEHLQVEAGRLRQVIEGVPA